MSMWTESDIQAIMDPDMSDEEISILTGATTKQIQSKRARMREKGVRMDIDGIIERFEKQNKLLTELEYRVDELTIRVQNLEGDGRVSRPRDATRKAILEHMSKEPARWEVSKTVAASIDMNESTISSAMIKLYEQGVLERRGNGNRNCLYRIAGGEYGA